MELPGHILDADAWDAVRPAARHRGAHRFVANRLALVSAVVLGILALLAVLAGLLPLHDPTNPGAEMLSNAGPSAQHWLGTDATGFDLFSRLIYGMRPPFFVGVAGQALTTTLGVLLGMLAGYYRGWVDFLLSRLTDLFLAVPSFMLMLLAMGLLGPQFALLGGQGGTLTLIALIGGLLSWPILLRFVRGQALSLRERQFVEAARAQGVSEWRIMARHILPNIWGTVLLQSAFGVGGLIGMESGLAVLGLGVQPPDPDLGAMSAAGANGLAGNPLESLAPGVLLIVILVTLVNVGDGLRDAFDQHAGR